MTVTNYRKQILSNDYVDWIIDFPFTEAPFTLANSDYDYCYTPIDDDIGMISADRSQVSDISLLSNDFKYLPELYGLQDIRELEEQQRRDPLNLTGKGVIIGIADTGIDYTDPVFRNPDGTTRIISIWDQTIQDGEAPELFNYGSVYIREQINEALSSDNPKAIVPTTDDNGHGTRMASVASGRKISEGTTFTSTSYDCEFVIVKMKQCKNYLREYFLIADDVPAYQSSDIMMAVRYIDSFARPFLTPVVFCMGIESGFGDHIGNALLARYFGEVAFKRSRVMLLPGRNEENAAHHFSGLLTVKNGEGEISNSSKDMEIKVGENEKGFILQIWSSAPTSLAISICSPCGGTVPRTTISFQPNLQYGFVYAKKIITLDYTLIETGSGDKFILMRFQNPSAGIWTVTVTSDATAQNTSFNAGLLISQFLSSTTYFLEPDMVLH